MVKTLSNIEVLGFASVLAVGYVFMTLRTKAIKPTAEEQAWLDSQMETPRSNLTIDEQKWLDKQIQDTNDAEMLDDARQVLPPPGSNGQVRNCVTSARV